MLNKIQAVNFAPSFTSNVVYNQEDAAFLANGTPKVSGDQALQQVNKLRSNGHMNVVEIHHADVPNKFEEYIDFRIYDYKDNGTCKCRQALWNLKDAQYNFDLTELYKAALNQNSESPYCRVSQWEGQCNPLMKKFFV